MINETIDVLPQNRIDEAALDRYLSAHLPGYAGELQVRQFPGGFSNPTYALNARMANGGRRDLVMRKRPAGNLLPSAHQVDREFRVIRALQGSGVPVPATHFLCEDEAVLGQSFFVMDHVPGRIFGDPAMPGCPPAERRAVYGAMIDTLARLHAVEPGEVGLADYGRPGDFLARFVDRWSRQYRASQTDDLPEMEQLAAWLKANLPPAQPACVMHGDYRLGNLIVHPREPRIVAVLDWELSTLGDPFCDLAYTCLVYHIHEGPIGLEGADYRALGIPDEDEQVRRYCQVRGIDQVPHWRFYMAVNLFKLAANAQGAYKRALDGTGSAAGLRRKHHVARRARMACELAGLATSEA
ncbi:phosphotransferase family protein [Ramlibacter henchirensis]|uniref:Phosphotransferase family protein n=1 Tax=Ramlibacter henchirensis TaxID=204072 RepID=A0A4Z0BW76_9BURK|nr:phosphotransferase family protein [Ramlibacter henchirensis]TFZ02734.1 phosphotransferase family protein [Ramlibacter henchirensis]